MYSKIKLYSCFSLLTTVLILFCLTTRSEASTDLLLEKSPIERQKMPSMDSIMKFFSSIDQSMIDRIRNTVKIANLIAKLRKLIQFKQQLREGLTKRMEFNGIGFKSLDKSLKAVFLTPGHFSSIYRYFILLHFL